MKDASNKLHHLLIMLIAAVCFCALNTSYARPYPFDIVPASPLPTTLIAGDTTNATYTITNNTGEQRNNNFLKYLPPNVTQVTGGGFCGTTFSLAPGASCTLQLLISGPVNASDPDPHSHLFACFPGGLTCAGTRYPLNVKTITLRTVSVLPSTATINLGNTQQYSAVATYSDGSTKVVTPSVTWSSSNTGVATISGAGLATSAGAGTTTISATFNGVTGTATLTVISFLVSIDVTPSIMHLHPGQTQQYTATGHYSDSTQHDITSLVTWTSSDPTVATISSAGLATAVAPGTTNITTTLDSITSTPAAILTVDSFLYVVNDNSITYCQITSSGGLTSCLTTNPIDHPQEIAINPSNTFAYVTSAVNNSVFRCNIDPVNGLSACTETATSASFTSPGPIAVHPNNHFAYIADNTGVFVCAINSTTGELNPCSATGSGLAGTLGIAVNPAGTFAYFTAIPGADDVGYCSINSSSGALSSCILAGIQYDGAGGITINPAGTLVYVTNVNNVIKLCSFEHDGSINNGNCQIPGGFQTPKGIVLSFADKFAYITNFGNNTVSVCTISGGTLTSCTPTGTGFSSPYGVAIN